MCDLAFLAALLGMGPEPQFLFVLTYACIDIVAPQRLTYPLPNAVPVSLIVAVLAVDAGGRVDDTHDSRFARRHAVRMLPA